MSVATPSMPIKLFPEPLDLDEIEKALEDEDFLSLAFLFMGFEQNWRASLEQTAKIMLMFEDTDRDHKPVYRMISALISRAETFQDTGKFLDEIVAALGLLPGTKYFEEIKMSHLHKIDPHAWQRAKNQEWVENYKAQMGALRGEHRP